MTIKNGGGADPVVSAVLNAIGASYLVDEYRDEDGNYYRLYSDGFLIQGGKINENTHWSNVTFPKAFSESVLYAGCTSIRTSQGSACFDFPSNVTLSSATFGHDGLEAYWIAFGY